MCRRNSSKNFSGRIIRSLYLDERRTEQMPGKDMKVQSKKSCSKHEQLFLNYKNSNKLNYLVPMLCLRNQQHILILAVSRLNEQESSPQCFRVHPALLCQKLMLFSIPRLI